ncbi:hypothetical protein HDU97_008894 [Phlyctochytrium planicorne]|nr:hypothetical protein HDU97_008894 [Phlyctochytrium planicorne]
MSTNIESPKMEYRFLGRSGLKVPVLSFGAWMLAQAYDTPEKENLAIECIKASYEAGMTFFDNAEIYANGLSETVMGKAFKKHGWDRSTFTVSTKIYWGGQGENQKGLSRKHIVEGTKASLKRLQLEYVDLIFAHRPDALTPMEEIVTAFNWVIQQGWAFYWGTSEWSAEQIMDAHRVAEKLNLIGPLMEQPQYNMFTRDRFEKEYAPLYQKVGLGTTIWSPLASGILTGKYNDQVPEGSRLSITENAIIARMRAGLENEEGKGKIMKVKSLEPIAKKLDCTLAQLALAWCAKNPNVSTVITGASKLSQVHENVKALEVIPKLTPAIMDEIETILGNRPTLDVARF